MRCSRDHRYAAIDGARTSIDVTMYELEDGVAEQALVAAARRAVAVRVLLNRGGGMNASAFARLRAGGVQVRWSPPYFALTHQKTITVDHRRSLVMTMNLIARYYADTRDFVVSDGRRADVKAIEAVFDADWAGRAIIPSPGSGDLLWSPGAQHVLIVTIDRARASLDVENEELAYEPIVAALCRAAERGVRVRLVMTYQSESSGPLATLGHCGASVRVDHGETPIYIHAKEIIADGTSAYVGSQNFSYDSLTRNRELGLVIADRPLIDSLEATFARDYQDATGPG
jgi:phosphatidylserine/phosphatidylglycerophosphate/cardiolipin synthase-like enzyme